MSKPALRERRRIANSVAVHDPVAWLSRYELMAYLGCALDRMDRVSTANGLEGRVPFLDAEILELAGRVPIGMKLNGLTTKFIVKEAARPWLAAGVVDGRKSGFGLRLADWFRSPAFRDLLEPLRDRGHRATEFLDPDVVRQSLTRHLQGADHSELLWLLVNVYAWYERNN